MSGTQRKDPTLTETELAALSSEVERVLGLHFPRDRWPELDLAFREWKTSGESRGETPAMSLSDAAWDFLASRLTNGETYFFRNPEIFDALPNQVLPALLTAKAKSGDRTLRIWSAGCSTGEEPYSLAIRLQHSLPAGVGLSIVGTDIDARALERARNGHYTEWSFRGWEVRPRGSCFVHSDGKWAIRPEFQRLVRFERRNLLDRRPPPFIDENPFDIIFCRHVLMYFSERQRERALRHLGGALRPGGWLILGTSESPDVTRGWQSRKCGDCVLFQKTTGATHHNTPLAVSKKQRSTIRGFPAARDMTRPTLKSGRKPEQTRSAERPIAPASDPLHAARQAADGGDLAEALRLCDEAAVRHRANAALHHLRATILIEDGRLAEAENALRQTLYLDPNHLPGHVLLGELRLRQGDKMRARKSFTNVLDLLGSISNANDSFTMDDLSAQRLESFVRTLLDSTFD